MERKGYETQKSGVLAISCLFLRGSERFFLCDRFCVQAQRNGETETGEARFMAILLCENCGIEGVLVLHKSLAKGDIRLSGFAFGYAVTLFVRQKVVAA